MTSDFFKFVDRAKRLIDEQAKRVENRANQIRWLQHYGYTCDCGIWSSPPIGNRRKGRRFTSANLAYKALKISKTNLPHLPEIWNP
jgi:hypothetical protein